MRNSLSSRRGFTLIELMAVVALLSLLFTMAAVLMQLLLRSDETVSRQQVLELTLRKLAEQFREDAHAATECRLAPPEPGAWELEFTGFGLNNQGPGIGKVRYRVDGESLIREALNDTAVATREDYRLPECGIAFRMAHEAAPRFVVLSIDRVGLVLTSHPQAVRPLRQFTVEAELARHQRFMAALKSQPGARSASNEEPQP